MMQKDSTDSGRTCPNCKGTNLVVTETVCSLAKIKGSKIEVDAGTEKRDKYHMVCKDCNANRSELLDMEIERVVILK